MVKNLSAMQEAQKALVPSLGWEDPLEEKMANHSLVSLPGKRQDPGQRSLAGYSPKGYKELDTTE